MLVAFAACTTHRTELPVLDIEAAMNGSLKVSDNFSLNEIVEVVDIIPIETRPDALIGSANLLHIGKNHYYLRHDNAISRIDHNGKIVNTISRQGRGPGEYLGLTVADVDENASTIRIFDRQGDKYVTYDMAGTVIAEGSLSEKGVELLRFIGDDFMVMRGTRDGAYLHYVTDRDMNILQGLYPMDTSLSEMDRYGLTQQVNVGSGGDAALVGLVTDDTLYRVDRRTVTPEAILHRGRYRRPEGFFVIRPEDIDRANPKYLMSTNVSAFGGGLYFVNCLTDAGLAIQLWHKDGRLIAHSDSRTGFEDYGFRFTFPSGGEVRVSTFHIADDAISFMVDAVHAGIEGVEETDNPVIVVAKLKK